MEEHMIYIISMSWSWLLMHVFSVCEFFMLRLLLCYQQMVLVQSDTSFISKCNLLQLFLATYNQWWISRNTSLELMWQVYLLRNMFHGVCVLFVSIPQPSRYHGPSYPQNSEFADSLCTMNLKISEQNIEPWNDLHSHTQTHVNKHPYKFIWHIRLQWNVLHFLTL